MPKNSLKKFEEKRRLRSCPYMANNSGPFGPVESNQKFYEPTLIHFTSALCLIEPSMSEFENPGWRIIRFGSAP